MPRQRIIKPEFWTSPQVVQLSTLTRLLFIGLWNFADDAGILPLSPLQLKLQIFPADDITPAQVGDMINNLIAAGLLQQYDAEGGTYIRMTGWHRHQRIDRPTYKYPQPHGQQPQAIPATTPPAAPPAETLPQAAAPAETETAVQMITAEDTAEIDRYFEAIKTEVTSNVAHYQSVCEQNGWKKEYGSVASKLNEFVDHYWSERANSSERAAFKRDPVAFFRMKFPAWIKKGAEYRARDRGKPKDKHKPPKPPNATQYTRPPGHKREPQSLQQCLTS
mgnify:CR=1 FL=1